MIYMYWRGLDGLMHLRAFRTSGAVVNYWGTMLKPHNITPKLVDTRKAAA